MWPTSYLPRPALLLSPLASLALFLLPAMAQKSDSNSKPTAPEDNKPAPGDSKLTPGDSKPTPGDSKPTPGDSKPSPSDKASPLPTSDKSQASDKATPSPTDAESSSAARETPVDKSSSSTPTDTAASSTTASSSVTTPNVLTGFPTLTRGGAIPTYPPPAVPPTQNAPFLRPSSLPEGTVFIVVGAILGALGVAIILWRGIVSLLLHRSVKRAALAQHHDNIKKGFPAPSAPFYKYTDQQDSTMSLGAGAAAGRGVRRTNRGPIPSATPSHSNLFFSPTAVNLSSGPRASAFLPSGFYASGSGAPVANHTTSISLNNLRPDFGGTSRNNTMSASPPDSPEYAARRDASATSTSSLHLNSLTPGQRAPSAYLEGLLADDPNSLPPPQMPPSAGPRHSTSLGDRTGSPLNRI